jgi:hypothetical protein
MRRRGDADVKALLLEIKRLHAAFAEAYEIWSALPKPTWELEPMKRLSAILTAESAIARQQRAQADQIDRPSTRRGKIRRGPPTETEGQRRERWGREDSEREAKRPSRERR